MNCDQVIHLFTDVECVELRTGGGGVVSILQAVEGFILFKLMLNLHSTIRLFPIHVFP